MRCFASSLCRLQQKTRRCSRRTEPVQRPLRGRSCKLDSYLQGRLAAENPLKLVGDAREVLVAHFTARISGRHRVAKTRGG